MYKNIIIGSLILIFLYACVEDMPSEKDGRFTYQAVVIDTLGIFAVNSQLGYAPFKNREITLESKSYFESDGQEKKFFAKTDNAGKVHFENLALSDYVLYTEIVDTTEISPLTGELDTVKISANVTLEIIENSSGVDTLYVNKVIPGLVINEIYYAGPVNKAFYFYDLFIELYNASDTTVYLDGMMLCRARQSVHPDMETNDFVQGIYVHQFPGVPLTGREYPLEPGKFTVVAGDAVDHSQYMPGALDLSAMEWEFYNPYAGEVDNPALNVTNILIDRTTDFLINLSHNAIILTDGSDWYYGESYTSGDKQYVHLPFESVIDAVEYSSNPESNKELTKRLDAGFAGIGISKYSGKSTERRIPGFDTNNSTLDFITLDIPTPGY